MKNLLAITLLAFTATSANAEDFSISFNWDDLQICTSGQPNTVGNPVFTLTNVPEGTKWLYFKLTDLDVPGYPHGGGWIEYSDDITKAGVFQYRSPCPPNGSHSYEWKVTATTSKSSTNDALGIAFGTLDYPE